MLRRTQAPFIGRWNGVGGKLKPKESPEDGVRREILEETPLRAEDLGLLRRIGAVWWTQQDPAGPRAGGMHVFLVTMRAGFRSWEGRVAGAEGELSWIPLREVLDPRNPQMVRNLARVLPTMLRQPGLQFHCDYRGETLLGVRRLDGGAADRALSASPAPIPVAAAATKDAAPAAAPPEPSTPPSPSDQEPPPPRPRRGGRQTPTPPPAASQARARSARRTSS